MFCLDNSSYMRNGDLNPTRLKSQELAVSSLLRYKLEDNIESSVGLLTMAGYKVEVQISPSRETHKMMNALKDVQVENENDILSTLRISHLTLRNRSNKHQRQRIVMFIGSPITVSNEQLINAGRELKKNSIALDIVLFGYESLENNNFEKCKLLIDTVQNGGNSHLITHYDPNLFDLTTLPEEVQVAIPLNSTSYSLTDLVMRSAVGRNIQPRPVAPAVAPPPPVANVTNTTLGPAANPGVGVSMMNDDDEELDDDLLAAIELSKMEFDSAQSTSAPSAAQTTANNAAAFQTPGVNTPANPAADVNDDEEDMDPDLLAAIQLSLMEDAAVEKKGDDEEEDDFNALLDAVSGGAVTKKEDEEKKD